MLKRVKLTSLALNFRFLSTQSVTSQTKPIQKLDIFNPTDEHLQLRQMLRGKSENKS
jgi:hypothetical protein